MSIPLTETSLRDLVAGAARELAAAGVTSPRHDAEVLAAHLLRVPRSKLLLASDVLAQQRTSYEALVARRAARVPLQHIVGSAPFRHLELRVGPGVLIPRPETELLVDAALSWLTDAQLGEPRIVDLGTGTGALALALATECRPARVWAVERDPQALAWAVRNIAASEATVGLVASDMAVALPDLSGRIDVVVSNPPYLPLELLDSLEPEVRDHDPRAALFPGSEALAGVRAVEAAARRLLRPGGLVVVEHGADQGETAPACFAPGWGDVTDHVDLAGRPRYLTAIRVQT